MIGSAGGLGGRLLICRRKNDIARKEMMSGHASQSEKEVGRPKEAMVSAASLRFEVSTIIYVWSANEALIQYCTH